MSAVAHYSRRCQCRDDGGTPMGAKCPQWGKHGPWSVYLNIPATSTEPRERIRYGGFETQREAKEKVKPFLVAGLSGQRLIPAKETLGQYLPRWLDERQQVRGGLKPSTVAVYAMHVEALQASSLGKLPLTDISRSAVQSWAAGMAKVKGAATVSKAATVLKSALHDAVRRGILPANPASEVDLPTIEPRDKVLWTPTEVSVFLGAAQDSSLIGFYELALYSGLRRGELAGLRWSDVDMKAGLLTVNTNRVRVARRGESQAVAEGTAKSAAGQGRRVGLGPRAVKALRRQRLEQNTAKVRAGEVWEDSGRVFTTAIGGPIMPDYPSKQIPVIARKAQLAPMRLHGLRHVHATLLRETGADGFLIATRLGHSQGSVTSIYAHVSIAAQIEAADRAERAVPDPLSTARTVLSTRTGSRLVRGDQQRAIS